MGGRPAASADTNANEVTGVQGLGPGSVLGGRYTVSRRVLAGHGAERWEARDEHLQRDVTVLAFPSGHVQADAVFDAARRAAGVRDQRLVAVLDVGRDEGVSYVVEEGLPGARNYAAAAVTGGLPGEEVRRVVGEAALGLDAAARRGLHHGALSPESVLVTEDGDVKVLGLATTSALAGRDDEDSDAARRVDAVGLVGLTYAGLTGRWPLPGDSGGLPSAPRIVGGTAAPSEIAVGVPADLDTICRLTLNEDEGPTSPGDFAGQIAPWSPNPVEDDAGRWTKDWAGAPGGGDTVPDGEPGPAAGEAPVPPAPGPDRGPGATAPLPVVAGPTALSPVERARAARDAAGGRGQAPSGPEGPSPVSAAGSAVAAALGSAATTAGTALGALGGRARDLVRTSADRAQDLTAERRAVRAAQAQWTEEHRVPLKSTLGTAADVVEPPAPLLPAETAEPLSRDESRTALLLVAGFLAIALAIGLWGASRIGSHTDLGLGPQARQTTISTPTKTKASPTKDTSGNEPLAIAGVTAYDPQGDNAENNGQLPRIYDGNPDTFWSSEGYNSAQFGGLKSGVGVIVDIGANARAKEIVLDLPTPTDVQVSLSATRSLEGAKLVGESTGQKGQLKLTVPPDVTGQYVVIWFTKPVEVNGRYRAALSEVQVLG